MSGHSINLNIMLIQNLADYLHDLLDHLQDGLDSFVSVGANEMSDAFLMAIHDNPSEDFSSPNDVNGSVNEYDDTDDNELMTDTFDSVRSAMDVIFQERQAVILGNPGSGKTTLLLYVLKSIAYQCLNSGETTDVPVYIPLKELSRTDTLEDRLTELSTSSALADAFKQGRVFLFLDGLNEVQPSEYDAVIGAINRYMKASPNSGLIVTSRLYGYAGQLDLPTFLLQELTNELIGTYILNRIRDNRLLQYVMDHEALLGLARNPLLLNMLVSIWQVHGELPEVKLHLYEQFISYQLSKAGIVSDRDRQMVADSLSRLAYSMRRYGYLSDSLVGLDAVVSDWVGEDKAEQVTRMLMASGMLSVTCKGSNFWCISFMHETFQEYYSTLFIYRKYVATDSLCEDLSLPEWEGTLQMLTESISLNDGPDRLSRFMQQLAGQFAMGSQTAFFNDHIDKMFRTLSACSSHCTFLLDWMAQYLLFNMANFLNLPYEYRTIYRFEALVDSIATLDCAPVNTLLFRSYRWMQYWLYENETVEQLGKYVHTPWLKVITRHIARISNKLDVYQAMLAVKKEFGCFEIIHARLQYLQVFLSNIMDTTECKSLYRIAGDMDALLRTNDFDFIEKETAGKTDLEFPRLINSLRAMDKKNISLFYLKIFDRLDDIGKKTLLSVIYLPDFIMRSPGLDELLLASPVFADYQKQILMACHAVPPCYLSPYYFNMVQELCRTTGFHKCFFTIKEWYRNPAGIRYFEMLIPSLVDESSVEFKSTKVVCSDAVLRRIQLNRFTIVGQTVEPFQGDVKVIEPDYATLTEVIPVKEGDEICFLHAKKTSFRPDPEKRFGVRLDGISYILQFKSRATVNMILSSELTNKVIPLYSSQSLFRNIYRSYYYLFRNESLQPWQLESISGLAYGEKTKWGVIGLTLNSKSKMNVDALGIVKYVQSDRAVVHFHNKAVVKRFPIRFVDLQPGDVVLSYRSFIHKIMNRKLVDELAMVHGTVISKNGSNLFISTETNEYNGDYYYYDNKNCFEVGDRVRFFPVLNQAKHFHGKPMACFVKKMKEQG